MIIASELQNPLTINTKEELMRCKKYEVIKFPDSPEGETGVYVGNLFHSTCSCGSVDEHPLVLRMLEDGSIAAEEILTLDRNSGNLVWGTSIVQDIKPTDTDYRSILEEFNKGGLCDESYKWEGY